MLEGGSVRFRSGPCLLTLYSPDGRTSQIDANPQAAFSTRRRQVAAATAGWRQSEALPCATDLRHGRVADQ